MDPKTTGMIVLGAAFIALSVVAYFSARTWHWGHVVLVELVFLAGAGATVLAAEALHFRSSYQKLEHKYKNELELVSEENLALKTDTSDEKVIRRVVAKLTTHIENAPALQDRDDFRGRLLVRLAPRDGWLAGIGTLETELQMLILTRGNVWRHMQPSGNVDTQTGEVVVGFPQPAEGERHPNEIGIEKDMVLFVFEEGYANPANPPQGAQYFGKFQVTGVANDKIKMVPIHRHSWTSRQMERLAGSQRTWSLYEMMPSDRHDLFALKNVSPEERAGLLKTMFPAGPEEYIRDGGPANADDDPTDRVPYSKDGLLLSPEEATKVESGEIDWRYERHLRDYGAAFTEIAQQRVLLKAETSKVKRHTMQLRSMTQNAEQDLAMRREEKQVTEFDLAGFQRERQAMDQYLETVRERLDVITARVEQTLSEGSRLASQLAAAQLKILQAVHGLTESDRGARKRTSTTTLQ